MGLTVGFAGAAEPSPGLMGCGIGALSSGLALEQAINIIGIRNAARTAAIYAIARTSATIP